MFICSNLLPRRLQVLEDGVAFSEGDRRTMHIAEAIRLEAKRHRVLSYFAIFNSGLFVCFLQSDDFRYTVPHFEPGFDPGAAATTLRASEISGSNSAGIPITISPSSIPENFREPSHPSEKFT